MYKKHGIRNTILDSMKFLKVCGVFLLLLGMMNVFALPLESNSEVIYVLLGTTVGESSSQKMTDWSGTGLKGYIQNKILNNDVSRIYEISYNLNEYTPAVFASNYIAKNNGNSILEKAVQNWYNSCTRQDIVDLKKKFKTLKSLRDSHPEVVPSKFVVIADGASGLAVREYIQGSAYKGEIANVIFFNTPHEGTGFADQAIFEKSNTVMDRGGDKSKYAALIPLALIAYLTDGVDGLQEMMISLLKDAVMGMAYDNGDIKDGMKSIFEGYSNENASTWYLSQDASESDDLYEKIIGDNAALLGSTQYLNSYSKNNLFDHPAYNIVYSYGLPTIGNGRRTLSDFVSQAKNHISKEKIAEILVDSLKKKISTDDFENINKIASSILENRSVQETINDIGKYSENVNEIIKVAQGIDALRKTSFNKDDIPGSVYKLLRVVEKFIPDCYKAEIYSLLMEYFTPETKEILTDVGECVIGGGNVKACAKEGALLMASNLANYSLNFFDEGAFDVPAYSAIGENVAAFKESFVGRLGYGMQDVLDKFDVYRTTFKVYNSQFEQLKEYRSLLSDVGELETDRKVVDIALNVACSSIKDVSVALGEACSAAEFATNVTLVGITSSKIKRLVEKSSALTLTREAALMASSINRQHYSGKTYHGVDFDGEIPDIESMLFGSPRVSIASVRTIKGADTVVVPLMFTKACKDGKIFDSASMENLCELDARVEDVALSELHEPNLFLSSTEPVMIKDVSYDNVYDKIVNYGELENFKIEDYIRQIHFQVDDFQPDSMRWIKLDFNARVQIVYERENDGTWKVYFEKSYQKGDAIDVLTESPISREGRFSVVFQNILDKYNDKQNEKKLGDTYELGGLMEDGNNVVYVSAMNKIGKTYGGKFSFFFKATEFNYNAGWPVNYAKVSRVDSVSAFVNNMGYNQYEVKSVGLTVSRVFLKSSNDAVSLLSNARDSVVVSFEEVKTFEDSVFNKGSIAKEYRLSTSLKESLSKLDVTAEGEYILEWTVIWHNPNQPADTSELKFSTDFVVDTTAPKFTINLKRQSLMGNSQDGIWADIVAADSMQESVRAIRGLLLDALGHEVKTIFHQTRYNSKHLELKWNDANSLPSGVYKFVVQAYDFAVPDSVSYVKLLNITDEKYDLWNYVANGISFKIGNDGIALFNGAVLDTTIWIDNVAPQILDGTIKVSSILDTLRSDCHEPVISGTAVNLCSRLSIAFKMSENRLGRKSTDVKVALSFKDTADGGRVVREFVDAVSFDATDVITYNFEEGSQNKLNDGVYDVYVELTDEVGNSFAKKVAQNIIIDRTPPSVYSVNAGGRVFENVSEIKNSYAYVQQDDADERLISSLSCYKFLNAAGDTSGWVYVDTLIFEKRQSRIINFSIADLSANKDDGAWTVYLGCYDAAGNFGYGLDFFGMGARYPRITFPNDSINSFYYGKVLVKGVVENPVSNGNDNEASFELEWKAEGDSAWHKDGFEYLSKDVGGKERELAIWNLDGVMSGVDTLRLSVRACGDTTCPWRSSIIEVPVYARIDPLYDTLETKIDIDVPSTQKVGEPALITIQLDGTLDTAAWKVESKILMKIPGDTALVEADAFTFDPAIVSPFKQKPDIVDSGLYIWQEGNVWNICWKGTPKGVITDSLELRKKQDPSYVVPSSVKRMTPKLSVKYKESNVIIDELMLKNAAVNSVSVPMIDVGGVRIPSFDRIATWELDSFADGSLHLQFVTDSAFVVDVSTVEAADSLIYCGNRHAYDVIPTFVGVGTIFVHPEYYKMHHVWKGSGAGGIYADGAKAYVKVIAYNKNNPSRILMNEDEWLLSYGDVELVCAGRVADLYFDLGIPNSIPFKRNEVVLKYGLRGRAAYVTEEVVGPNGRVIKTFKSTKLVYAGEADDANIVSWNGEGADGLVESVFGQYQFRVTAYDDASGTKQLAQLIVPFEMKDNGLLLPADVASKNSTELFLDEAKEDEYGDLRYVGSIDYLMKNTVSADYLPREKRNFYYKWSYESSALQYAAIYKKYRFSAGIHRHRNKFPVTVAVLVVSEGFNVSTKSYTEDICPFSLWGEVLSWLCVASLVVEGCNSSANKHPYVIMVKRMEMEEGGSVPLDVVLRGQQDIVGYNDHGSKSYDIITGVKVLPADVFKTIGDGHIFEGNDYFELTGIVEDEYANGHSITSDGVWNDAKTPEELRNVYVPEKNLSKWFNNFDEQPVFWESSKYSFRENAAEFKALSSAVQKGLSGSNCIVDNSDKADESSYVCGPKTAEDELDKEKLKADNPHVDMLDVSVEHMSGNSTFSKRNFSAPDGCKDDYSSSGSEVALRFVLKVKTDYWNPWNPRLWGYNNLANRYVRFDPTNKTLYGDGGYFRTNYVDQNSFDASQKNAYKNHYGVNGWEYSYKKEKSYLSPFEAERFPMRQTGMNPLLFGDEINANSKLYESLFSINYFSVGGNDKIRVVARDVTTNNSVSLDSDAPGAKNEHLLTSVPVSPLNVSFAAAPFVSVNDALINDEVVCSYPCTQNENGLQASFDGSHYGRSAKKDTSFAFYTDWRSRIHYAVGDWDDNDWKVSFVVDGSIVRNPVTDENLFYDYTAYRFGSIPRKKSWLDSIFVYKIKKSDVDSDQWVIPYDSIRTIPRMYFEFGEKNADVYANLVLKEVSSKGDLVSDSIWKIDKNSVGLRIWTLGQNVKYSMNYIFSLDTIKANVEDRMHFVPLANVLAQNRADSLLSSSWVINLNASLDSICERDTSKADSQLERHRFLVAGYDADSKLFSVKWNGQTPIERVGEIGTFRGRVPGDSASWTLTYVNNGYTYFVASGVQDTFPEEKPYPILARVDMSKLQGNTSFFLMYGNEKSAMHYRGLDVRIGQRVNPDDSVVVQTMLANGQVNFLPGAWGVDPIDVTARTVGPEEYVYKTFEGLAVNGPVLEVLPSHDFGENQELWPVVKMKLTREDFASVGYDVSRLKIYKPNFEEREIQPLEQQWYECYDEIINGKDEWVPCANNKWDYVYINARTQTFSSFVILDTNIANEYAPVDSVLVTDSIHCVEVSMDTIWMGTFNGWLEYPYACEGRSNYLLQLRVGSTIAAEHKGLSTSPIVWNARNRDVWIKSDVYTSRVDYFGVDGTTKQIAGPFVRVDSVAPSLFDELISVDEKGSDRIVSVRGSFVDTLAGVSKVHLHFYYGSYLVDSLVVQYEHLAKDSSFAETFLLDGGMLRNCLGCRASVDIMVEDAGHNYSKDRIVTEKIYPYPKSLVLWYPLSEGYGVFAHEMLGTNLHLNLNRVSNPWMYGGKVSFVASGDYAASSGNFYHDKSTPLSIEFRGIVGIRKGSILTDLSGHLKIYVDNKSFYVNDGNKSVRLSTRVGTNTQSHYVFVFKENVLTLYVDGLFAESVDLSNAVYFGESFGLLLGSSSGSSFFRMNDLRIYDDALTAEQIRDLFNYEYVPDEKKHKLIVTRAIDVGDYKNLIVDQSCALPGKAYLRQKNTISDGWINWTLNAEADKYGLFLLMRGYSTESSLVEVSVNNKHYGTYRLRSSGLWESVRVGDSLSFMLAEGSNVVSVRPVGNVGVAGIAVVSSPDNFDMARLDFGQSGWTDPEPRVEVRLLYENAGDKTWARPRVQFRNLTGSSFAKTHFRYYYRGEGSEVQATAFGLDLPRSIVPEAGDVYYADFTLTAPIVPYGNVYDNNGLQLGLHRNDFYFPWNIFDDLSYEQGAENEYVLAKGVALLDENGELLNEWVCYDDGSPADVAKASVVALAKEESDNPSQSSKVRIVVENRGSVAIDGLEVRYFYRDAKGVVDKPDYYDFAFADTTYVNVGGNLYYISFMYNDVVLNPGERNAFGNGAQFALHNIGWQGEFDASDDPSHYGLGRDFSVADSIVVLDKNGNLLWGNVPQPKFADNYVLKPSGENRLTRAGDVVYVIIDETGYYVLETVNAVGYPLARLYEGTWKPGEYMVQISADKLNAGGFLVLRKGNEILNWQLLK